MKIWDVASGQLLRESNLEVAVSKVEFSAEGSTLVTGDLGGRIIVWDAGTLTEIRAMSGRHGGFGFINDLALSADGRFIISASVEANAIIWNVTSGEKFAEYESAHGGLLIDVVRSVAFRPGTSYALSFGGGGELHTYDVGSGDQRVYEIPSTAADMAFSPDGRFLVCGRDTDRNPNILVFDFEGGTGRFAEGHYFPVKAVAFFPDGKRFATSAYNGTFKIWDAATTMPTDAFGPNISLDLPRTTSMRGVVMGDNFDDNRLAWSLSDDADSYQSVQHGVLLLALQRSRQRQLHVEQGHPGSEQGLRDQDLHRTYHRSRRRRLRSAVGTPRSEQLLQLQRHRRGPLPDQPGNRRRVD